MASSAAKAALFDALASVAQALGSGRRAEIVDVLAQGERSVEEIAGEISQSVANTSQHLQVLARAGLVRSRRDGTRVVYRLASERVGELWAAVRDVAVRHVAEVSGARATSISASGTGSSSSPPWSCSSGSQRGEVVVLDVRPEAGVPGRAHRRRALGAACRALDALAPKLPRRREVVAYCRGPYCVYADDAVRLLRAPRPEGAPAGRRLSRSGGAPGCRSRSRAERRPDAAATRS